MISWPTPSLPTVAGSGRPVRLHDPSTGTLRPLAAGPTARIYVCGITPYDATHIGHAATYVTFDVLVRALLDAGHDVDYVQNVTDVDDPLLERAHRDGVDWTELACAQIALFREDLTALRVIPPDHFVGVVESVGAVAATVEALVAAGRGYQLPSGEDGVGDDTYFDLGQAPDFGSVSGWSRAEMMAVFADRGGDPQRPGKRDPLDPLLWRAARPGEPSWPSSSLGPGRPGWHVECTTIAVGYLGMDFDVQGGGTDLIFPHHEMSAVQATGLTGERPFARWYVHQAMVGLHGEKMSKSRGNLVLVSRLRSAGVDPMAIRLVLLAHHYRTPWDWSEELLTTAERRLAAWRAALAAPAGADPAQTLQEVRAALSEDLDTPAALAAVDRWADRAASATSATPTSATPTSATLATVSTAGPPEAGAEASHLLARAVDALLGVRL